MGLIHDQQPRRSPGLFHDLPTPPPSTPLPFSLSALPPQASTVNIHITNHHHYSIQTPPDSTQVKFGQGKFDGQTRSWEVSTPTSSSWQKTQYKSPLLQRLVQNLSPARFYGYLTPAATPEGQQIATTTTRSTISITGESSLSANAQQSSPVQREEVLEDFEEISYDDIDSGDTTSEMPKGTLSRFSASARNARILEEEAAETAGSSIHEEAEDEVIYEEDSTAERYIAPVNALRGNTHSKPQKLYLRTKENKDGRIIPKCYNHDIRRPEQEPSVDVVPCDWVRPFNSQRFNNYTNGDVQCGIPKCDGCISIETYGPASVWQRSAPQGQTAESHRLRSRIRYLCSRCPQPAPRPPGNIGPIEMCTCVLRDGDGIPTDMWFQCKGCAESAWFEHDSKYGGPDGVLIKSKRGRKRKNKYGIIIRPRKGRREWRVKRCVCGKITPKDGRYGAWCTWCQCPVAGKDMMEKGGAATKSGVAFLPKEGEEVLEEGVDVLMKEVDELAKEVDDLTKDVDAMDNDSGIGHLD